MKAIQLPFNFDIDKIRKEINSINEDQYYNIYNPYVANEQLYSIHLIKPRIEDSLCNKNPVFIPSKTLESKSYLKEILATFKCEKETFRIHRLVSGGHIRQHRDIGKNYENGNFRLHIPIQTDQNVLTQLDGEQIKMQEGECWYLNFHLPHEIKNNSDRERIHLIIDCKVNDWWHEQFKPYIHAIKTSMYTDMSLLELESMKKGLEEMDNEASSNILNDVLKEINLRR